MRGHACSPCSHSLCVWHQHVGRPSAYLWRLWFPARPGGDPSVVGGLSRQAPPRNTSNRALGRAHSRPAVARGDWISDGAGLFPSGFPSPPISLVFLLNWWGSLVLREFGASTLAVACWVSERVYWAGRRPSSSPCNRINCALDDDSPLGFAVILSPVGEGWAVGCFPGQFLRQTELIKRSLWLDDEPTWW